MKYRKETSKGFDYSEFGSNVVKDLLACKKCKNVLTTLRAEGIRPTGNELYFKIDACADHVTEFNIRDKPMLSADSIILTVPNDDDFLSSMLERVLRNKTWHSKKIHTTLAVVR